MPIIDKFKEMGTLVMGKVESGSIREGDYLVLMPNKVNDLHKFSGSFPVFCLLLVPLRILSLLCRRM